MGQPSNSSNPGGPYQARPDLGPGVGFGPGLPQPDAQQGYGMDPATGMPFGSQPPGTGLDIQGNQPAANLLPQTGGPAPIPGMPNSGMGGGKSAPIFGGGQQQPITQGTGQLPPGFVPSPIDRSQIGPGAQIGMTGSGIYGRDMSGNANMTPMQGGMGTMTTPANRFAPPGPGQTRPTAGVPFPGTPQAPARPRPIARGRRR
jgi:hypothetical protein